PPRLRSLAPEPRRASPRDDRRDDAGRANHEPRGEVQPVDGENQSDAPLLPRRVGRDTSASGREGALTASGRRSWYAMVADPGILLHSPRQDARKSLLTPRRYPRPRRLPPGPSALPREIRGTDARGACEARSGPV